MITTTEWKLIAPLLPPTGGPGKPRLDDRLMVSAFYYAEATRSALECLPAGYGNPRSLRTRRRRWTADGTLARLMEAGKPVIRRMHDRYWDLLRAAPVDWNNSREFFGRGAVPRLSHAEPRGRYADRQR
jgi:Putative transposase of IS4/5 family (DUF4096)